MSVSLVSIVPEAPAATDPLDALRAELRAIGCREKCAGCSGSYPEHMPSCYRRQRLAMRGLR